MKNTFKEVLITLVYYIVIYFIITYALSAYPSNGGPSEAVFLLLGLALLSIIIFLYSLVKLLKGDIEKMGPILTHLIAIYLLFRLLS
jgi:hypothetical protein